MTEEYEGFNCINCNKTYENCNPSYIFSAKISDYSDSTFISFMGDTGNAIMGMSAAELYKFDKEGNPDKIKKVVEDSYFKQMTLTVRAKTESFNGNSSSNIRLSLIHI